jgi:hypothetical protein
MSGDQSRSTDDATVDKIASEVLRYLEANPLAKDTREAIAKWWIARQRISESLRHVDAALSRLTSRGEVEETTLPDGTKVYGKARPKGSLQ